MPKRNLMIYSAISLFLMLVTVACGNLTSASNSASSPGQSLTDLESIEQLQTDFNEDGGNPRLLMILSPL